MLGHVDGSPKGTTITMAPHMYMTVFNHAKSLCSQSTINGIIDSKVVFKTAMTELHPPNRNPEIGMS